MLVADKSGIRIGVRAREAFEYYYLLGFNRSQKLVAEKFNVSLGTVAKWATRDNWMERVRERDAKNMEMVAAADDKAYVEQMRQYKKAVSDSVDTFIKNLQANKVSVNSVKDLDKLVRLDLELSDRILVNDNNKLASIREETGDSSLKVLLSNIRGDMNAAEKNSGDESKAGFSSVEDITDDNEDAENGRTEVTESGSE